jgi:hypothetical protein
MKVAAPFAERILQALIRASPVAVDGHCKTSDTHLAYEALRLLDQVVSVLLQLFSWSRKF